MDIRKLQRAIVDGLEDVKAQNIAVFNTEQLSPLFERVIVASGTSNRQTKALASSVRESVKRRGLEVLRTEGEENGEWIIVDCGAAVCHVMQPAIREYYRLEEIWGGKAVKMKLGTGKSLLPKGSEGPVDEDEEEVEVAAPAPASAAAAKGRGRAGPAAKAARPARGKGGPSRRRAEAGPEEEYAPERPEVDPPARKRPARKSAAQAAAAPAARKAPARGVTTRSSSTSSSASSAASGRARRAPTQPQEAPVRTVVVASPKTASAGKPGAKTARKAAPAAAPKAATRAAPGLKVAPTAAPKAAPKAASSAAPKATPRAAAKAPAPARGAAGTRRKP